MAKARFKAIYMRVLGSAIVLSYGRGFLALGTTKLDTNGYANLALDLASIINFVALLLMLRAVIKSRNALRGYSVLGSFLTFISIVGFEIAYLLIGNVVGFTLGWATVAFWFIAFLYTLKQRLKSTEKQKEMIET
jgi:hypothetical protein